MSKSGQAFPNEGFNGCGEPEKGMTLRDYFAAKAMQGWLSGVDSPSIELCAKFSYEMADAMVEARK